MSTCKHERTHPNGCDDCPAMWCGTCQSHQVHTVHKCAEDMRAQLAAAKELARACQSFDVGNEPWECVMVVVRDFCRLVPREEGE